MINSSMFTMILNIDRRIAGAHVMKLYGRGKTFGKFKSWADTAVSGI